MKKKILFSLLCLIGISMQMVKAATPMAKLDGTTMTIVYSNYQYEGYKYADQWGDWKDVVTKIVFDESMKNSHPTSTKGWFKNFTKLATIEHLDYLNTDQVTDMSEMFYGCSVVTTIDVTSFVTSNVTDMHAMFGGCRKAKHIYISKDRFDTRNVTNMASMFSWCSSLEDLTLWSFMTSNVTNMQNMFYFCETLETINATHFDMSKVTTTYGMFRGCKNLKTIYVSEKGNWSAMKNITSSNYMFLGCTSLVGWNGTTYDEAHTDIAYAHPDYLLDNGYFTKINDICNKPINFRITDLTQTGVRFEWDAETGTYDYQFRKVGEDWSPAYTANGTFRAYQNLQPATQYEFQISTRCTSDAYSDWETISFITLGEGIEEVMANDELRDGQKVLIDGVLYIRVNNHLFDAQGKQVK